MKIVLSKITKASAAALTLATLITGCAVPQQGPMFYSTSKAIRAAQTAGALEFAPNEYQQANESYRKAETMHQNRRTDRAQKLLELATAHASLAEAISEAAQAESSLEYLRSGSIR